MDDKRSADDTRERPLSEPPPRMSDARLGRYRLAFEIATGGMASLYLAVAEGSGGFGKVLALKRIHPHLAKEADFREMFLDEARVASLLHHPNVCGVLDYGEQDGLPYFTMEYLLGEPLSRVQRMHKRMVGASVSDRARFAARVIADAAHGLHAAHELRDPEGNRVDLVHRDVSPQNLIVTYDGVTRVVDFGIARTRVQSHHTATGTIKGKFAYMAPEQLLGEDVDRRADIWALGVVLWETLTGTRLFKRKTEMETLLAVTQSVFIDPATIEPELDPELTAIVKRALTRELDERYATAEEMARDLERFLVKDKQLYGTREVSARMHELFPDGLEAKRQLIADALARRPGPALSDPTLRTQSTSTSVGDIDVAVPSSEPRTSGRRTWMLGGGLAAAALVCVALVSLYWRPFADAGAEQAARASDADDDDLVVPLEHQPPPTREIEAREVVAEHDAVAEHDGAVVPPQQQSAQPIHIAVPAADADDEEDESFARERRRRSRAVAAPAAVAATPQPSPSASPQTAQSATDDADRRRRPFLIESLDVQGASSPSTPRSAPQPSSRSPRRPLVVEELQLGE